MEDDYEDDPGDPEERKRVRLELDAMFQRTKMPPSQMQRVRILRSNLENYCLTMGTVSLLLNQLMGMWPWAVPKRKLDQRQRGWFGRL